MPRITKKNRDLAEGVVVPVQPALPRLSFIGNSLVEKLLTRLAGAGNLSHAYLLVGADGVGKRTLVRRIAAAVLGCEENKLASHPDFILLERERDAKTEKLHASVTVVQARQLVERLSLRSFAGGWRVAIVDGVDTMNAETANTLLKTLEEPGEKTVIFLLAEAADRVLATIRSRVQSLRLNPVSEKEIANGLLASKVYKLVAEEAAVLAAGRPGRAVELAFDPEKLALARQSRRGLAAFFDKSLAVRAMAIDGRFPAKTPYQELKELASDLLDELSVEANGRGDLLAVGRYLEAKRLIAMNANPKLAVEWAVLAAERVLH